MEEKEELIFGIRSVIEAINAGKTMQKVLVQKGLNNPLFGELKTALRKNNIQTQHVPIEKINKMCLDNHQGVLAIISPIEFHNLEDLIIKTQENSESVKLLMLDRITDVRNFGAIARTAECFGIHGIIIPEQGSAPINGISLKTSAGALHSIPICRVKNLIDASLVLKSYSVKLLGASEKSFETISEAKKIENWCLVMGSEEDGINPKLIKNLDDTFSINMTGKVASLNVSVAAGIFLDRLVN
jgi:23S rRNA (guanosine2251-2'-O)-methyltransferase